MTTVIRQVVGDNSTTIRQIVTENDRGPQGEQGETGAAATIVAGNAYSVPSTSDPSVINSGTSSAAVFDFYIPKGEKGDTGTAPIVMTTVDPGEGAPLPEGTFLAVYEP